MHSYTHIPSEKAIDKIWIGADQITSCNSMPDLLSLSERQVVDYIRCNLGFVNVSQKLVWRKFHFSEKLIFSPTTFKYSLFFVYHFRKFSSTGRRRAEVWMAHSRANTPAPAKHGLNGTLEKTHFRPPFAKWLIMQQSPAQIKPHDSQFIEYLGLRLNQGLWSVICFKNAEKKAFLF